MRVAALWLLTGSACAPRAAATLSPVQDAVVEEQADTVRGIVRETGSEPATQIVLNTASGATVRLEGERPLLRRVVGLEVMVRGVPVRSSFAVREVSVRAANGVPAIDGVLDRRGGGYVLVTRDGRSHLIAHLPDHLRGMMGARVWLAGPLDQPVQSSGVLIEPAT